MKMVRLGKSEMSISCLGLGAWQAGGKQWGDDVTDQDCIAAIERANELGVNFIDTAEVYGNGHSEEVVGKALQNVGRENVCVATKVAGTHLGHDDVIKACDGSLKRLGVDMIDLYQIHWPSIWDQVPLKETMRAMESLYKDGKIGAIGVSNFCVRDLEEARHLLSTVDIVSNQVQYSMVHREVEKEVLPYCQKEKITVLAWAPLAEGALTGKYSRDLKPKDSVRERHPFFKPENIDAINNIVRMLGEIGGPHKKTPPQVALTWLMTKNGVVPIPGAKNPKQVEENAGAEGWELSTVEKSRIEAAIRELRISFV